MHHLEGILRMSNSLDNQLTALNTAIKEVNTLTLLTIHVEYLCKEENHIVKRGSSLCLNAEHHIVNEKDTAREILSEILALIQNANLEQNAPKRAKTCHAS